MNLIVNLTKRVKTSQGLRYLPVALFKWARQT